MILQNNEITILLIASCFIKEDKMGTSMKQFVSDIYLVYYGNPILHLVGWRRYVSGMLFLPIFVWRPLESRRKSSMSSFVVASLVYLAEFL